MMIGCQHTHADTQTHTDAHRLTQCKNSNYSVLITVHSSIIDSTVCPSGGDVKCQCVKHTVLTLLRRIKTIV